jgi:hypothetical protein
MKTIFIILLFVSCINTASAQSTKQYDSIAPNIWLEKNDSIGKRFYAILIPATFNGGVYGWVQYMQTNLNADLGGKHIKLPKGQKEARQSVMVNFTVKANGQIDSVYAENIEGIHKKLVAEAIRVIKDGPNWIPAEIEAFEANSDAEAQAIIKQKLASKQRFRQVSYKHKQNITFAVRDY